MRSIRPSLPRAAAALALVATALPGAGCAGTTGRAEPSPSPSGTLPRRAFGGVTADVHGRAEVLTSNTTVRMADRRFEPNVIAGAPGLRVSVMLRNEGRMLHSFTLPSQGIAQDVPPSTITSVDVVIPVSGEAVFWCRFHRDDGMVGLLEVL